MGLGAYEAAPPARAIGNAGIADRGQILTGFALRPRYADVQADGGARWDTSSLFVRQEAARLGSGKGK